MRVIAPWLDFEGHPVKEGDRIIHPSGDSGFVVFIANALQDSERWRVDYGHGSTRSLFQELGEAGRATVVDETGSAQ